MTNKNKVSHHKINKDRSPYDFYPTEPSFTKVLMDRIKFNGLILEPACGTGKMSEVIESYGYKVKSSDLIDFKYGSIEDFFNIKNAENIITNPPYNIGLEFINHALQITSSKIAMLMKLSFLDGQKRNKELFSINPPHKVIVISNRMSQSDGSKSQFAHAWFIWDNKIKKSTTTLNWAMAK
ncbi:NAD(P)-dependent oxidoreductase [Candidatus Pacearchaeota archaeon]|nr:NAD(P)-dependent oxidoreductase [Candidatus Pacearchaeota archaeon]